jgi:DNA-binding phage protein
MARRLARAGPGVRVACVGALAVTREALYRSLSEAGDPRLSMLLGAMRALGVRLVAEVG